MEEIGLADVAREACVLLGAGAAILEQLAMRPVGLGVAEHSTTLERPLDRLRTTLAYVYVLALGTPEEQRAVAAMVNRSHRPVRSAGRYSAFDPDLQGWVAATLAHEGPRLHQQVFGPMDPASRERVHRESAIYATALQVSPEAWPPDVAAFEDYWQSSLRRLEPDPSVQEFARRLLSSRGRPPVVRLLLPLQSLMARGGVPPEVREVLALPWSPVDQGLYALFWRLFPPVYRALPRQLRWLPARLYLADFRRRRARGQRVM
ncbi:MAG TPA: oxygenase MpaB family protein [Marmoricola sp.]|nr:oxygenase MpaB family protein [Marmoricola sp.]